MPALHSEDPPPDLMRRVIARETKTQQTEANYTYRQTVTVEEYDPRGIKGGEYREVRDIIFSPTHERTGQFASPPTNSLTRLKLTDEDFRDLRDVQPFAFTKDQAALYERKFRGDETIDGIDCWVIEIKPRQILQGQRLFEGLLWAAKSDFSIIQSQGQAVPQILTTRTENLFPRFTTKRQRVDGDFWFPATTIGDDTLPFRSGPQRIRLTIRYSQYRKFGAESTITYQK